MYEDAFLKASFSDRLVVSRIFYVVRTHSVSEIYGLMILCFEISLRFTVYFLIWLRPRSGICHGRKR